MSKTWNSLITHCKNYFTGPLLVPWIWLWGPLLMLFLTYIFGFYRGIFLGTESFRLSSELINLLTVWVTTLVFLGGNYSIAYLTKYSYPKLQPILLLLSVFIFLIFWILYFPFLLEAIRIS